MPDLPKKSSDFSKVSSGMEKVSTSAIRKMNDINTATGRGVITKSSGAGRTVHLFFNVIKTLPQIGRSYKTVLRQIDVSGFGSILVLALIAGLTGMIMALQTGSELSKFGVLDSLGAIIGATFCRELGPIWAAIIILSRVGASMAAEIGTMVVNEEVDALEIMSIDPVRYLVMPRVVALIIAMPLLTTIADIVGLYGGAFVAQAQFGLPTDTFFDSAETLLGGWD
ncbi:MAG: ABC transporter permease, partial [Planctomycetes bacterium]|nr:ABC transporter permease [Planctomycetota bacterium]